MKGFRNEAVRSNGSVIPLVAALAMSCGLIGCTKSDTSTKSADVTPAAGQTTPMTAVEIPKVPSSPGDNLDPLPADAPYPSDDPRDLEGLWVGVGMSVSADGQPPPLTDTAKAESARFREAERSGKPLGRRGSLCRPPAVINLVNQFPIQILQRPDEIIVISEELRGIWHIHMNQPLPEEEKVAASYGGYNVGHWEGNTLVIESIGFRQSAPGGTAKGGNSTSKIKIVTRITRANDGDKRNGDRLVIRRTTENPARYTRPYTESAIARWRPDLDMLEFNCEESTPALAADGLVVE